LIIIFYDNQVILLMLLHIDNLQITLDYQYTRLKINYCRRIISNGIILKLILYLSILTIIIKTEITCVVI